MKKELHSFAVNIQTFLPKSKKLHQKHNPDYDILNSIQLGNMNAHMKKVILLEPKYYWKSV